MIKGELDCRLIDALRNPACYPHPAESVKLLETHISWVLLAGDYVYKIKKPVDFGFLNFSELSQRKFFCHEELRLNSRLAPDLYLEVVGIGGTLDKPSFNVEPVFEYAVKMKRFAEEMLLDHVLAQNHLSVQHMYSLAETMADFHKRLTPARGDAGYGDTEAVVRPTRQNFQQLSQLLDDCYGGRLNALEMRNEQEYQHCLPLFAQRLENGKVRECHGDLHLGNIVLLDDKPTPFDGIEFNPALRWIDVINDIAFLLMDLQQRQRPDLAFAFINRYLLATGDYESLAVLRFYLGYRAMVMAKVTAIRAAQLGKSASLTQCESYLALAERFYSPVTPALIITHGLPGCGKTTVSEIITQKYQAIRIRSDVERKRLFDLQAHQRSQSGVNDGIYTPEVTQRTYQRLLDLSGLILQSGFSVVVDAAFLKRQERQQFQALAEQLDLPFVILNISSEDALIRKRIQQRHTEATDASEADIAVYEKLKFADEALIDEELQYALEVINNREITQLSDESHIWNELEQLIAYKR